MSQLTQRHFIGTLDHINMTTAQLQRKQIRDAKTMIEIAQMKMRYPTSNDCQPCWQIDYEKYGGFKNYTMIKNMYWKIASYYIDVEGRYEAFDFPLTGYSEETTNLLKEFREDLQSPIRLYA